jgi:hypothetical protein
MHPPEHDMLTTLNKKRRNKKYVQVFTGNLSQSVSAWECETEIKFEHAHKEHGFGKTCSNDLV